MESLMRVLRNSKALPVLFIGSGVSIRYLSSVNWVELLRMFSKMIDPSEFSYEKYENKASQLLISQGKDKTKINLLKTVADLIENDFNERWFEDDQFIESRKLYRDEVRRGVSPFKLEISGYFKSLEQYFNSIPEKYIREIELLKRLGKKSIAGIITTNYDTFLEYLFPEYSVYIGQENLIFSITHGVNEIYKIHGSCTDPSSIVINSQDYNNFERKNAYLAAKLMTIFVEHPIFFLGYSLEDENIQGIIKSIVECLSGSNLDQLKERLFFVEWKEGNEAAEIVPHSRDFGDGKIISMTKIIVDSYSELFEALANNRAKYPTRILRQLKQDIYNLALTTEKPSKILVMPMTEEQMDHGEVEVVIGFGIYEYGIQGYKSITAEKIYLDIVFDDQNFNYDLLVNETLPQLLKQVAYSLPVYKYINGRKFTELPECLSRFEHLTFEGLLNKINLAQRQQFNFQSVEQAIEDADGDLKKEIRNLQTLSADKINISSLEQYLKNTLTANEGILLHGDQTIKTGLKKIIKMYDILKYKSEPA